VEKDPPLTLDPRFTHLLICGDAVVLVGEDDFLLFEDRTVVEVVRLLDGRRAAVDIARATGGSPPPEVVHYVLLLLEEKGVVRSAGDAAESGPPIGPSRSSGLAMELREAWNDTLPGTGAARLSLGRDSRALQLILTEDYLHPDLAAVVRRSLQASRDPVLLARLGARAVWIGPLLRAGGAPCISCLQDRLRLNLVARTLVHPGAASGRPDCRVERLARYVPDRAFQLLAERLARATVRGLENVLRTVRLDGSPDVDHSVVWLPQCGACGEPEPAVSGAEVRLVARRKKAGSGGGFRTVAPSATLLSVAPMVDPLTGVVRAIRKVPVDGCELIHVYSANHAHHYGSATLIDLKEEARDHSGGKGWTDLDARVSAICESLERSSSIYRGGEPTRIAALSDLGAAALAPNDLMHFSERQFRTRSEWNERHGGGFQWIPAAYEGDPIEWSPVRSLPSGELRWAPSAFIYHGFQGKGSRFCDGDSNGLAGGNCIEEAVLQGFLELVERDAVAIWWYNRLERPGVNVRTSDDPWSAGVEEYYRGLGRTLWALDLTTDLDIPVFAVLSAIDGREVIFGFGAHLDPRMALRRALTEMNQMLTSVLLAPEERRTRLAGDFPDVLEWWGTATLESEPYLRPASGAPILSVLDMRFPSSDDLREDVMECVARASSVGCDVLVHDLTRPDIPLSVVKVIVPGLRHFWRRLGPGRLYDLPVRLGWLPAPVPEGKMNPVSLFV
jgi:oxazoline/thiazoline synthase